MSRRRIFRCDLNSELHVATCPAKRQVTARNDTESFTRCLEPESALLG